MNLLITHDGSFTKAEKDSPSYNNDVSITIEKDVTEEAKDIAITVHKRESSLSESMDAHGLKDVLDRAKSLYATSWGDVRSYIKSLSGQSLEELDAHIHQAGKFDDDDEEDSEYTIKKKWVVYDMTRLAFGEDQIEEAVLYLDTLPRHLSREEMLKMTIEHLVERRRTMNHIIDDENDDGSENRQHDQDRQGHDDSIFKRLSPPRPSKMSKTHISKRERMLMADNESEAERKEIPAMMKEGRQGETMSLNDIDKFEEKEEILPGTLSCMICYNYLPEYQLESVLDCGHAFCSHCQRRHIEEHINTNKILSIPCPSNECDKKFEDQHVAKFISSEDFERYNRFKKNTLLSQNPNLRWCIRPGCDKYVIGKPGSKKVVCECKMKMCFKCGNQSHFGKSCEKAIDKVYKKYAKEKNVQACSQCKSRIEKSGGCDHMTCTQCKYEWCWLCGVKYLPDHFALSNPNRCPKMKVTGEPEHNNLPGGSYERDTYCSRICSEPILLIAFPLFLIFTSAMVPNWMFDEYRKKKLGPSFNPNSDSDGKLVFFSLLGFLLLPITVSVMLVLVLGDAFVDIYLWIAKKIKGAEAVRNPKMLQPLIF